ncbi:MAG TPA: LysM peptidoglycan-binding domain-containing protein [Pirellulales bacterium]|nr:LysM peptidoglycan-binding domain-containing protein [Pirellulales bacterium]
MNWVKAMLLMVVLGAILYGVNLVLNKSAPVESPANDGSWSTNTAMGPPIVNSGAPGVPPGYGRPSYGQPPAGQSSSMPPAYGSGTYSPATPATIPPTGYANSGSYPNNPAPTSAYGQSTAPAPSAGTLASPETSANNVPLSPTGYQPATPTVANSDAPRTGIPATQVGLVTNSPSEPSSPAVAPPFASVMESVTATLREGRLAAGLQQLTAIYDDPKLSPEETKQLNDLLGRLAGTVVYSRQHLLLPPYEVQPGDRLETIAANYQVPAALLAKINGIADPDHPPVGAKLKVIRGPFMALVSMNKRDLTLLVQQCFAGRFTLAGVGKDAAALSGDFKVDWKSLDGNIPPPEAGMKYPHAGSHWIDFHAPFGFCAAGPGGEDSHGLMLNPRDAEDLFDILSVGSTVVVR